MRLMKRTICFMVSVIFLLGILIQPVFAGYEKTYEAEDNTALITSEISSEHSGFTGTGFIDYGAANSSVMWNNIEVPSNGSYTLSFRYSNGAGDGVARPCTVEVNGTKLSKKLECQFTGDWDTWSKENVTAALKSGKNTIKVIAVGNGPNIDNLLVTDGTVSAETAASKAAPAPATSAASTTPAARTSPETVSVDFGTEKGEMRLLSGFLHAWDSSSSIPDELITALKPQFHRAMPPQVRVQKNRSAKLGVTVIDVLSDGWGYNGKNGWPGDGGNWTSYDKYLTDRYNEVVSAGYDLKNIHFDIWNEANGTGFWNPEGGDVAKNRARFIETWIHAYKKLKQLNPSCIIEGPSLSDIWYKPLKGDVNYPTMTAWVDAVITNKCIPEYLSWHFAGASLHWKSSASTSPSKEIEDVRKMFTDRGVTCPPIIINEFLYKEEQNPASAAWNLAQFHRADVYGACHAIWGPTFQLDQLLIKNGSSWLKKGEYWMGTCYAKMTGVQVNTTNSENVDLTATKDSSTRTAHILLGNRGKLSGTLTVQLNKIGSSYSVNGNKVHVLVQQIPYNEGNEVTALNTVIDKDYPVSNDQVELNWDWTNGNDAYYITLGPGGSEPSQGTNIENNNGKKQAFNDLAGHWAKDDIVYMVDKGIVKGVSDTKFEPDAKITRVEFVALLSRVLGLKDAKYTGGISDVSADSWYVSTLQSAMDAGIIPKEMLEGGNFKPEAAINRQEMTALIMNSYKKVKGASIQGKDIDMFSDKDKIASWALEDVKAAYDLGIINGISSDQFAPMENADRAQATVIVKRLLLKLQ